MVGAKYELAKLESKYLEKTPTQNEMLKLYALAKVAENVDIKSRPTPGMFDFAEKEKRKAWQKVLDEKVTPSEAEKQYVDFVEELKEKYGEKEPSTDKEKKELTAAKKKKAGA